MAGDAALPRRGPILDLALPGRHQHRDPPVASAQKAATDDRRGGPTAGGRVRRRLADDIARRAEGRALRAAIDALPEKQRTVLLLHYFEEYSCEEIALMLDCSVGTIWSRLHYGCRKLRDQLRWLEQP